MNVAAIGTALYWECPIYKYLTYIIYARDMSTCN